MEVDHTTPRPPAEICAAEAPSTVVRSSASPRGQSEYMQLTALTRVPAQVHAAELLKYCGGSLTKKWQRRWFEVLEGAGAKLDVDIYI